MDVIKSINGVPVRLTDERWVHVIENHDDLAGYYDEVLGAVESPDYVIIGFLLWFIRRLTKTTALL